MIGVLTDGNKMITYVNDGNICIERIGVFLLARKCPGCL